MLNSKTMILISGLFLSFLALNAQTQWKNELNLSIGFVTNPGNEGIVVTKLNYSRWFNSWWAVGGGLADFHGARLNPSWDINAAESYHMDVDVRRFLLNVSMQIQPLCVSFAEERHAIALQIEPCLFIHPFSSDRISFDKYPKYGGSLIDSQSKFYRSGTRLYFGGEVRMVYQFRSLAGIHVAYSLSNVDIYRNLRDRKFENQSFNPFLPKADTLQGIEIGLSYYLP